MLPTAPLTPPHASPPSSPSLPPEPPFCIRVEHRDVRPNGDFVPEARVSFAAPLRTGGLLAALAPEEVLDLLLLLTFVTPNGGCAPTVHQLAAAMGMPEGRARRRLERLLAFRWQGEPLVVHQKTQSGLEVFALRPWLAPVREDPAPKPWHAQRNVRRHAAQPAAQTATREEVIAHTRATYARPRAQVEREIEEQMGYTRDEQGRLVRLPGRAPGAAGGLPGVTPPARRAPAGPDPGEASRFAAEEAWAADKTALEREEVTGLLIRAGLQPEQAESLTARYDLVRIRRQLMWLPYRRARNPAGLLLAAVKDDYEVPPSLH